MKIGSVFTPVGKKALLCGSGELGKEVAIVVEGDSDKVVFDNLEQVLEEPGVQMRIFGKPEVKGHRRMGVILATAASTEEARAKAERAYQKLQIEVLPR